MSDERSPDSDLDLWKLIPLDECIIPSEPPSEAVITGLRAFWARLTEHGPHGNQASEFTQPTLQSAPLKLLDRLVPTPDWIAPSVEAIDQALDQWTQADEAEAGCQIIVGAPHSGIDNIIRAWAEKQQYRLLDLPTQEQILGDSQEWFDAWPREPGTRFVLPQLERCYLRHYRGLELVRRLVDRLWHKPRACVITCDSWAWAYLLRACQVNLLRTRPWCLSPLTATELEIWIRAATDRMPNIPMTFRRADNGKPIIRSAKDTNQEDVANSYLTHVAARSRGNPGVAWALWRHSLNIAVDEDVKEEAQAAAERSSGRTIWVRPWEKLDLPAVPTDLDTNGAFILHALLLHGGLPHNTLASLLSDHPTHIVQNLRRLQAEQIIAERCGAWYVTPLGYPSVRSYMRQEDYLVDVL